MTPLAATATAADHALAWLVVVGVLAVLAAGYALGCWIWPIKTCKRCEGSGKSRSPSGKAWRRCPRCKGSGGRTRFGRWVWNRLTRLRREAG